jgi:hypothetical protein
MQINKKHRIVVLGTIIFFVAMASLALFRLKDRLLSVPLPIAIPYTPLPVSQEPIPMSPEKPVLDATLPAEVNLKIPFTSQAPHQNWDLPYKEFCEEASILMTVSYVNNQPILGPDDADAKLLAIKDFEEEELGFHEDTNAEDTAKIIREFYKLEKIEIIENPTALDIRKALAQGKAVIAPFAGRELKNPNYQQPGPLYHMLVIKGYRKNGDFITNDPGTKRGADYIYKEAIIMNALHDWNDGDVKNGKKVIITVG